MSRQCLAFPSGTGRGQSFSTAICIDGATAAPLTHNPYEGSLTMALSYPSQSPQRKTQHGCPSGCPFCCKTTPVAFGCSLPQPRQQQLTHFPGGSSALTCHLPTDCSTLGHSRATPENSVWRPASEFDPVFSSYSPAPDTWSGLPISESSIDNHVVALSSAPTPSQVETTNPKKKSNRRAARHAPLLYRRHDASLTAAIPLTQPTNPMFVKQRHPQISEEHQYMVNKVAEETKNGQDDSRDDWARELDTSQLGVYAKNAPCQHVQSWRRLRWKKGLLRLVCICCGLKWDVNKQTPSPSNPSH